MADQIYKYVGSSYLDHVLPGAENVTLKCSYPKDFNDPYELFLTVDFTDIPEALAFYAEAVGDMPQIPTTCFSRSPIVIPMWAHYGEALRGFVVEFDQSRLEEAFPKSGFGDVDYKDSPDPGLSEILHRAYVIKKFRYVYMLQRGVFNAAYYSKATCWSYEQERRMLVREEETRESGNLILMDVPKDCVTALICGPRASEETSRIVRERALQLDCRFFDLRVGKSSAIPYLLDQNGGTYSFTGTAIEEAGSACSSCGEALTTDSESCSWCQITEAHALEAAHSNPFRILDHAGMLDSYIAEMNEITQRFGQRHPPQDESESEA